MIVDFSVWPPIDSVFASFRSPHLAGYQEAYSQELKTLEPYEHRPLDEFVRDMASAGVDVAVVKALDARSTVDQHIPNEAVAALVQQFPGRFVGFAGVDPHRGMDAVRELERAVRELGLRGLNVQLFENRLYADDRRMYPLYAKCVELDIPVNLHSSINFSRDSRMDYGHPMHLDVVAIDFPELKIVASPPGWPWVLELVGVAWRHPNVYIGAVATRPKYFAKEGSGWSPLLQYGGSVIQDRVVWGTTWPLLPFGRTIEELRALPLKPDVKEKWLGRNAATLLGLRAT